MLCFLSQYHSQPLDGAKVKTFRSLLIVEMAVYWLDLFAKSCNINIIIHDYLKKKNTHIEMIGKISYVKI